MWMIKWVEMNDCLEYYPMHKFFKDYYDAKDFQNEIDERRGEELGIDPGSIVSEVYIEEIKL
jgi:hypothetical protein